MAQQFGGFFGGPDLSQYRNPFQTPKNGVTEPFDRNLFEQNGGAPAMGYFAGQSNTPKTFQDWILKQQGSVQSRYQGAYAAKNDPTYSLTDWMSNWNPVDEYNQQTAQDRLGSALTISPFIKRFFS